jgi:aquaporin Z
MFLTSLLNQGLSAHPLASTKPTVMNKYITEFIGTFFLVLTVGLTSGLNALAIGASLMIMIYAGGHISGAHYNPAVTLAVYIRKRISLGDALIYMGSQLAGGLIAALVVSYFMHLPETADQSSMNTGKAILAEVFGTFALAYVVLNVATAKANEGNSYFGLAIGFTVFVMATALGQFSGGAFNPAVAVGLIVMNVFELGKIWIYLLGCFGGAAIAALVFNLSNPAEKTPAPPEAMID